MSTLRRLDGDDEVKLSKKERTWGGRVFCGKKKTELASGFVEEWYDE
jgi:hypothetical protein